ncbi:MAG TPA: Uma2 family endonuclease [Gemmataceae bacterium]|jgi:Uma2 family endonuclease
MIVRVVNAELADSMIDERRRLGIDGHDEIWDGVYVIPPTLTIKHQAILRDVGLILMKVLDKSGGDQVLLGANVSDRPGPDWLKNVRVPDIVVVLDGSRAVDCDTHYCGGPDFLVEIHSPGDETKAKIPFYARIGVRELLVIHRDTRRLRLFRHDGTDLAPAQPDCKAKELTSAVVPLAFRRTTSGGRPRTQVRRTDGTAGRWVI